MEKDGVVFCPYIMGDIPPIYFDKDQIVMGEEISKRLSEKMFKKQCCTQL